MTPYTVNFLKHLAILAGLGALVPVIGAVLAVLSTFNPATLPVAYQVIAGALLPVVVGALSVAKAKAAAAEAAEEAKAAAVKAVAAEARATAAEAKVAELSTPSAPKARKTKGDSASA